MWLGMDCVVRRTLNFHSSSSMRAHDAMHVRRGKALGNSLRRVSPGHSISCSMKLTSQTHAQLRALTLNTRSLVSQVNFGPLYALVSRRHGATRDSSAFGPALQGLWVSRNTRGHCVAQCAVLLALFSIIEDVFAREWYCGYGHLASRVSPM